MIPRLLARLKSDPSVALWLYLFVFLGLASPTVISYSPYGLSWDPVYYLRNATCMHHAIHGFSLSRVAECLTHTAKGLSITLGLLRRTAERLGSRNPLQIQWQIIG